MSIVDVLITIIVVTILVTIVLGVVTYLAYKLRLARKPSGDEASASEPRYFELHMPPAPADEGVEAAASGAGADRSPAHPTDPGVEGAPAGSAAAGGS